MWVLNLQIYHEKKKKAETYKADEKKRQRGTKSEMEWKIQLPTICQRDCKESEKGNLYPN